LLKGVVTSRSGNDFPVLDRVEHRDFPHSSSASAQLIGIDDFRNLELGQQSTEERTSGLRIPMFLHQHVQHGTVFVYSSP